MGHMHGVWASLSKHAASCKGQSGSSAGQQVDISVCFVSDHCKNELAGGDCSSVFGAQSASLLTGVRNAGRKDIILNINIMTCIITYIDCNIHIYDLH